MLRRHINTKIRPVILCGGSGTRLWPNTVNNQAKQFIDFGGWNLLEKTFIRVKSPIFDYPIISTNQKYLGQVRSCLKKINIKKYKIILEPAKKNTAPAVLASALIKDIPNNQTLIFFPADHLIEKVYKFNKIINKNKKYLTNKNIAIFGIKPTNPSSEYGYFLTKKINKNINKVTKFIEKPKPLRAKKIIKKKGYWNSGIFFSRKDSIINNFKKYQKNTFKYCTESIFKAKCIKNTYYLNKNAFNKIKAESFDYAILEKLDQLNALKIDVPWSDLGSWREISKIYLKNKSKYFNKKNVFLRPWGSYTNLFYGKNFLVKELTVKPNSSISLQKHYHRSEYWMITQGKPKITINKKKVFKKVNDSVFIPSGSIHRIENIYNKPVKIIEVQTGSILKESDIVRYKDIYNRV